MQVYRPQEFRLNKDSTDEEIRFAVNYPGKGNIIVCEDDDVFDKLTKEYTRVSQDDHRN